MKPRTIDVTIDELVLHGFEPRDRHAIAGAFQRELGRLFSQGAIGGNRTVAHVDGGTVSLPPGSDAPRAGAEVARAVHQGVSS